MGAGLLIPNFEEQLWPFVKSLGVGLIIFLAFWLTSMAIGALLGRLSRREGTMHPDLLYLLLRTAKASVLVFGLVTALGTAGVNVSALVAGLGLTGFALGFALRDILSNLLAGVLILIYHPFRRGDFISVAGLEGTVTNIDLRYTMLQRDEKKILIPNSTLFTTPVTVEARNVGGAPVQK